jgi:hypothetical protein
MANNAGKVFVGKPLVSGGIFAAPVGSTLPTDATVALDPAFLAVGYVTDAGLTKTIKRDTATIYAWGGDIIAVPQKTFTETFKFAMAEYLNEVPASVIFGDSNVTASTATGTDTLEISVTAEDAVHHAWVFEMKQGNGRVRIVVPDAVVSDTGDVVFKDDDVAAQEVTITAFTDGTAFSYEYSTSPTPGTLAAESAPVTTTTKAAA